MFFRSRIDASHARVIGHSVYRQHVRRGPRIDGVRVGITTQIVEARDHLVLQSLVDHILPPEIAHAVLDPLKIRDRHPAGVRQNVRNDENSLLVQDLVRGRRRRPIRPFRQHLALDPVGVLRGDLVLSRGRDQHVTLQLQQLLVANKLHSLVALKRPRGPQDTPALPGC